MRSCEQVRLVLCGEKGKAMPELPLGACENQVVYLMRAGYAPGIGAAILRGAWEMATCGAKEEEA